MKLYKINVQEDKQSLPTGETRYTEAAVQVFGELEREQQTWLMHEYMRENGKLVRIGVLVEGAQRVVARDAWGKDTILSPSSGVDDMWYEATSGWIENGYAEEKESIFGINACGEWTVIAYRKDGTILSAEKVTIIPRLLSPEQYKLMQREVKKRFEELAYQPVETDERAMIRELQVRLFPLDTFCKQVAEWTRWLHQIELNPAEILHATRKKKSRRQIRKWDAKAILEAQMFPYRDKLAAKTSVKETHIPEHQMIKWMLEQVRERIEQERATENSALLQLYAIQKELASLDSSKEEDSQVAKILEGRKQQVQEEITTLTKRSAAWDESFALVTAYLNSSLFDLDEREPEPTHLFASHPLYCSVLEGYEKIAELAPVLTTKERDFETAMIKSPQLYEVWMLLQLIHQLGKVKYRCADVAESLVTYFAQNKTLSGWSGKFVSETEIGTNAVRLYYEREMQLPDGKKAKPDYLLLFFNNQTNLWDAHALDAKYKPYTLLDKRILSKDIERSARRYLAIAHEKIKMKSAALVHFDKGACNWNIDPKQTYSLSHFHAVPGNMEGLQTYMKRLFHFFYEDRLSSQVRQSFHK